jgi:hypothetical protein
VQLTLAPFGSLKAKEISMTDDEKKQFALAGALKTHCNNLQLT